MDLSSIPFLFRFLPAILILYFLAPGRMKNSILFLGSLFFYAWGSPYLLVPLSVVIIWDTVWGMAMKEFGAKRYKRTALTLGMTGNAAIYIMLYYRDKTIPIGMGIFLLKSISYLVDCYKDNGRATPNLINVGTYLCLFTEAWVGPVTKYKEIDDRLRKREVDIVQIGNGAVRFVVGLTKKAVLGESLYLLWQDLSSMDPVTMSMMTAWLGIVSYGLAIYFIFTGLADMTIGLGAVFGFVTRENFFYPYLANTVTGFWKRWNMTLIHWFETYAFAPFGREKRGTLSQLFHLLIVWSLIGVWHGISIPYLLWGLWFAFWIVIERLFLGKLLYYMPKLVGRLYTWVVILLGWAVFAFNDLARSEAYVKAMLGMNQGRIYDNVAVYMGIQHAIYLGAAVLLCTPVFDRMGQRIRGAKDGMGMAVYMILEKIMLAGLLLLCMVYLV